MNFRSLSFHSIYQTVITICLLCFGCNITNSTLNDSDSTAITQPVVENLALVEHRPITSGTFLIYIRANGLIRAVTQSKLHLRSSGTLNRISVKNGSSVKVGQLLAQLDSRDQQIAIRQAEDQVREANVQLRSLIAEYGGQGLDTNSINKNAREYVLTKSGYFKAQTNLAYARQNLSYTELKAPYDGKIANLVAQPFNFITAYEVFCTILSSSGLQVEFSVLESELPFINIGQPIVVSPVGLIGKNYRGQVSDINPYVNSQGLVLVKARVNQLDDRLFEGMNVQIRLEHKIPNQLIIPKTAVVERAGRKVVFTMIHDGNKRKAKWNYINVFYENETDVAVSKGLKIGDEIIISGNLNLGHEALVK